MKYYIIIDLRTGKALYGVRGKTIKFTTFEGAEEFRKQMFENVVDGMIVPIIL